MYAADADKSTREMEVAIRKIPEIVSCHSISGAGTFELQVVSRDLDMFSQFARKVLINLPNVRDSSALPLQNLGIGGLGDWGIGVK